MEQLLQNLYFKIHEMEIFKQTRNDIYNFPRKEY